MSAFHGFVGTADAKDHLQFAVLVSADAEWRVVKPLLATEVIKTSPYGEYFFANVDRERVLFFQGGWGKVAAAGSTQYVIDHFHPARLINLGTCGGVEGRIKCFDVVAPEKVVIYDIEEAMGDSKQAIAGYSTSLPLPARLPVPVVKATMYSADRDLTARRSPATGRSVPTGRSRLGIGSHSMGRTQECHAGTDPAWRHRSGESEQGGSARQSAVIPEQYGSCDSESGCRPSQVARRVVLS